MVTRQASTTGITQRGITPTDVDFTTNYLTEEVLVSGVEETMEVVDDKNIQNVTDAITYNKYEFIPDIIVPEQSDLHYENVNPDVATIDIKTGKTNKVSEGSASFILRQGWLTKKVGPLDFSETGGHVTTTFVSWVDGSLMKEVVDAVDTRIVGLDPNTTRDLYDTQNHTDKIYVRNANVWCDVDLSGISPWNSTGGFRRAGTAITRDAVVFAEHYRIAVGAEVVFVTMDGQTISRTIVGRSDVGPANDVDDYQTDMTVGVLNENLPESITHYAILPSDIALYLPSIPMAPFTSSNVEDRAPALCLNQYEHGLISDLYTLYYRARFVSPSGDREPYHANKISGDSGSPAFLIVNGELVLVTTWTFGGGGAGPVYFNFIDDINTALVSAGSAYTIETVDLSPYNIYT